MHIDMSSQPSIYIHIYDHICIWYDYYSGSLSKAAKKIIRSAVECDQHRGRVSRDAALPIATLTPGRVFRASPVHTRRPHGDLLETFHQQGCLGVWKWPSRA